MKTIKQLVDELRDIDHEPTRQQQMGIIRYLQQLRVGSIVETPDGQGVVVAIGGEFCRVWFLEEDPSLGDNTNGCLIEDLEVIG